MSARTGGVASAFGFRYQYLVTVELLLEYYESRTEGWSVDVDRADQDSADILVFGADQAVPKTAIQVKASLEASSTTLGLPEYQRIVSKLHSEHPAPSPPLSMTQGRRGCHSQLILIRFDAHAPPGPVSRRLCVRHRRSRTVSYYTYAVRNE